MIRLQASGRVDPSAEAGTDPAARRPRVLVVEDASFQRHLLRLQLASEGLELVEAADGLAGLEACFGDPPDLVLLDLNLPFCDGFEVLRRLKDEGRTSSIPVIVVSQANATADKIRGLDLGAVDYVTKPYDPIELKARIRSALRMKRLQDLLERRAYVDGLTGLPNRFALEDRLATEWARHRRHGGALALWVVDLDRFKAINDTHGHPGGDEVLRRTAAVLGSTLRATDLAARLGGEEFVVVAPHRDHHGTFKAADRFRERLAAMPMEIGGATIRVTTSIGVASWPEDPADSAEDLLALADRALYQAKEAGRNAVRRWSPGADARTLGL